ncbi:MAG: efflux RND transporter permease subunit, partial [Gammaproteobacteria bacterium]
MLERLQRVTQRLETEPDVLRVLSLANATDVTGQDGEIIVGRLYDEVPRDSMEIAALRERLRQHPTYGDALVSVDGRATAVLVFFEAIDDQQFVKRNVSENLARIARDAAGVPVHVTGTPHIKAQLSRTIVAELAVILPAVCAITALLCALAFRSVRGVVLPLSAIAMSLFWTLGAMGWVGTPLNLVSNIIPPLLITLGFAGAMHMMSEYYEALRHQSPHDGQHDRVANTAAVVSTLEEMGLAMLANGLTTMLGFLSLCTSTVLAIRQFGFWSVVGVAAATLTSLALIPAALVLLGPPPRRPRVVQRNAIDRFAAAIGEFDMRHRRGIFVTAGILLAIACVGMTRIEVSSSFVGSFIRASPIRQTFDALNSRMQGLSSFYVVVQSDENEAFTRPENLRELASLQAWLEAQPEIASTASLVDSVMVLNRAFEANDPAAFTIPKRASQVQELLLFGGTELTDGVVDARYRAANITVRSKVSGSAEIRALLERLDTRLAQLPQRLRARATGDLVLLSHTMDDITRGMLSSSLTAFITIYLTLAVLLTSLRVGFYALLPNLVPVAMYYGA